MCGALLQTEIVFVCKMEKYILDGEIHTKDDCNFQLYLFSHLFVHSVDTLPLGGRLKSAPYLHQIPIYVEFCHSQS